MDTLQIDISILLGTATLAFGGTSGTPSLPLAVSLIQRELFDPSTLTGNLQTRFSSDVASRRYIDSVISYRTNPDRPTDLGVSRSYRFVWPQLSTAIEEICNVGDIGVSYKRRTDVTHTEYEYIIEEDRVPNPQFEINDAWYDKQYNIQVGDICRATIRSSYDYEENIGPIFQAGYGSAPGGTCITREMILEAGKPDKVRLALIDQSFDGPLAFRKLAERILQEEVKN